MSKELELSAGLSLCEATVLHHHWPELYGVSALNSKNILSSYWKEDYGYFDQTFPVSGVMERLVPEF